MLASYHNNIANVFNNTRHITCNKDSQELYKVNSKKPFDVMSIQLSRDTL